MHGTDIDIRIAGYLPDGADETGAIEVIGKQEVGTGRRNEIKGIVLDLHDMQFSIPDGTGDGYITRSRFDLDGQQASVVSAGCLFFFHNRQTAPGGDDTAVNDIDLFFRDYLPASLR